MVSLTGKARPDKIRELFRIRAMPAPVMACLHHRKIIMEPEKDLPGAGRKKERRPVHFEMNV
jgi:hypothetical protein